MTSLRDGLFDPATDGLSCPLPDHTSDMEEERPLGYGGKARSDLEGGLAGTWEGGLEVTRGRIR